METQKLTLHLVRQGLSIPHMTIIEVNAPIPDVGHVYELGELVDAPLIHDWTVTDVLRTERAIRVRCAPTPELRV